MIFVIVPEYPEVTSWKSMFKLMKRRIYESYKDRFEVYKLYTTYDEDEAIKRLRLIKFYMTKDFDLRVGILRTIEYSDNNELDKILEEKLLELDKENSICLIDRSFYLTVCRFMSPHIHIEFFNVIQDGTRFQLIDTPIVKLKEFDTFVEKEKNYEVHSVYTD